MSQVLYLIRNRLFRKLSKLVNVRHARIPVGMPKLISHPSISAVGEKNEPNH